MKLRYIPNIITICRILLIGPFLYCLLAGEYSLAFLFFFIAGASDGIDGFLARHYNWNTKLGGFLDPLADKLLMITSYLAASYLGLLPWWLAGLVIFRDVVIMSGVGGIYLIWGDVAFDPSWISKFNTLFQALLIFLVMFQLAFKPLADWVIMICMWIVVVTTCLSLIDYVWVWGSKALKRERS